MSRRILAAVIAATITLTACATPPIVNNNRDQSTTPTAVAAATVGTTQDTGIGGRVTLHEIRDNIVRGTYKPDDGKRWVGLDLEVCVDQKSTLSVARWQIHDTANHTYTPTLAFSDMPGPDFVDGPLNGGTCMRGWQPYELPVAETVGTVTYTSGNGSILTWK